MRKVSRAVEAHFHSWEGETPDSVPKQRPATVARHVVAMDVEDVEQDPRQQQRNEQKTKTGSGKDMFHFHFHLFGRTRASGTHIDVMAFVS